VLQVRDDRKSHQGAGFVEKDLISDPGEKRNIGGRKRDWQVGKPKKSGTKKEREGKKKPWQKKKGKQKGWGD